MEYPKEWKRLLRYKAFQRACVLGSVLCCMLLIVYGFELSVLISLMMTTYVNWTRKVIFLFSVYASVVLTVLTQLRGYLYLYKIRHTGKYQPLLKGLQLLFYASIGQIIWSVLMICDVIWTYHTSSLLAGYEPQISSPVIYMIAGLYLLMCLILGGTAKIFALYAIQKSLLSGKVISSVPLHLVVTASLLQMVAVLLCTVFLSVWEGILVGCVLMAAFCMPVFLFFYYSAKTYQYVWKLLRKMPVNAVSSEKEPLSAEESS